MRIVLIGAGNLATNLGKALLKAGHDIVQVYSRTMASAETLVNTLVRSLPSATSTALASSVDSLPSATNLASASAVNSLRSATTHAGVLRCLATNDLDSIVMDADLYIFSVKDSALAEVAAHVCKGRERTVFVHTAGSMPMDLFSGLASHYGVVYPMQTFSKAQEVDFSVIPTFIEYNDAVAERSIKALVASITQQVYTLSSADRKYLHLSAVWACNFVNHCYDISAQLLAAHHIPFSVMLPLIDETARKVHTLSPHEAQTGPAVRYDENVINAQAQLLADSPEWQDLYLRLSKSIFKR